MPEYGEVRAFAAERIRTLAVGDDHFTPRPLPSEPFGNSLGVFTGEPERIEILFDARTAPLVLEREWHKSQKFDVRKDGAVQMTLHVCNDYALLRWVLSFGSGAMVVAPAELAADVRREFEKGAGNYAVALSVMESPMVYADRAPVRQRQRGRRRAS